MKARREYLNHWLGIVVTAIVLTACASISWQVGAALENTFRYRVTTANYGQHGVIILKPRLENYLAGGTKVLRKVNPGLPDISSDFESADAIAGFKESLPKKLEVVWRLATLSDCYYEEKFPDYPDNVRKGGCTWTPIEGAIYRKQVDMDAIRASEAYARVGEPFEGSYLLGTKTLVIAFVFNEDKLDVRWGNGRTMGAYQ